VTWTRTAHRGYCPRGSEGARHWRSSLSSLRSCLEIVAAAEGDDAAGEIRGSEEDRSAAAPGADVAAAEEAAARYDAKRTEQARTPPASSPPPPPPPAESAEEACSSKEAGRLEAATGASTEQTTTVDPSSTLDHPVLPLLAPVDEEGAEAEEEEEDDADEVSRTSRRISRGPRRSWRSCSCDGGPSAAGEEGAGEGRLLGRRRLSGGGRETADGAYAWASLGGGLAMVETKQKWLEAADRGRGREALTVS
jgi:hypothetical protein